ncbi:glycosyl transferase [Paenibacillus sp. NFR01]|uniref:GH36-type glycosyl hydrolase domain-containing protein n=1 Tax=Paenibacillus sp. NFR01 TaxID=1566279 RepID=UPI0008BCC878|nr:glycosyl transferase [Paenibacillus sp. NFR01]SEU27668.1 Glycosyltransferase family 36 [Paenibacillus sp. NFR01]
MLSYTAARNVHTSPEDVLREQFGRLIAPGLPVSAIFADSRHQSALGVAGLPLRLPAIRELLKLPQIAGLLPAVPTGISALLAVGGEKPLALYLRPAGEAVREAELPEAAAQAALRLLKEAPAWAGSLNADGEHILDLRTPLPGPHFAVNLLLGNRLDFPHALQTTPKSVVDRVGGGSFRSHAATQVLATRWDMRQEENGFPANRQFYLFEDGEQIFYSAEPGDSRIESAVCRHSQNSTVIAYRTVCGLEITRTVSILPQREGEPLATELQRISIENISGRDRNVRLVYTGMFGSAAPGALFEDVLYSNVIMQGGVLRSEDGAVAAISPDYYPEAGRRDLRFHTMIVHGPDGAELPWEYCVNYNEFVGTGTLHRPAGALRLSSELYRKGPGFFAVAAPLTLPAGGTAAVDQLTGLVSDKSGAGFSEASLAEEVGALINRFSSPDAAGAALEEARRFVHEYGQFLQIESGSPELDVYVNRNLPFQVLYQSFVSRSFCQTQKGYREIGFREIQDLYASMYYFVGMGRAGLVRSLLIEWAGMVFEFGYAFHNFFWVGKEPGKWSDDALWLVQAVHRYVMLTGDMGILDEECPVAGTDGQLRPIFRTLQAIITYSGRISVGRHGLPLLDYADWNDCLKLDGNCINGPAKEARYRQQLEQGGVFGEPLDSDYSESVMNAFLLKLAVDELAELADKKGEGGYADELKTFSTELRERIQLHAWKGDFFARVLFNRYPDGEYAYLGAAGDGLSASGEHDGSYFLNSFSWSVLSGCADEEQVEVMLDTLERRLKTPYGLKLVSPVALGRVSSHTASDEYFPGDRENGGVFKHACMMAAAAMFKGAKEARNPALAARLAGFGYWLVDKILPYRTMEDPFGICGNPRFCTQYNNSETGENIGPMLSGTSTWLTLSLMAAWGVEYNEAGLVLDPVLRETDTDMSFTVKHDGTTYRIRIHKPEGFCRLRDTAASLTLDGQALPKGAVPYLNDGGVHEVELRFEPSGS